MADVVVRVRQEVQGGQQVSGMGKKLNSLLDTIQRSAAAAIGAGATFKKAFDFGRAGAEVEQLEGSFNRLNNEVFQMPDLLDDMRAATNRTVRDADLMSGVLTLTAGTTGEMSRALAAATPELLKMSKAASAINPMLGDTTFLFESLSVAAKRQSRLLADNAGIMVSMESAVREVHPALQGLASTYEELPDNLRFLNEMLFQGANLIEQAGSAADSAVDPWDRLATKVREFADEAKQAFAGRIVPNVEAAAGTYGDVAEDMIQDNLELATSTEDYVKQAERLVNVSKIWGGLGPRVTGTQDEINEGLREVVIGLARATDSFDEYMGVLRDLDPRVGNMAHQMDALTQEFFDYQQAVESATQADQKFFNQARDNVFAQEEQAGSAADNIENFHEYRRVVTQADREMKSWVEITRESNETQEESVERYESTTRALEDASRRIREAEIAQRNANIEFGDNFVNALGGANMGIDEFEQKMIESAAAAGLGRQELALLTAATADYGEEQIEAIVKQAAMIEKAEELGEALADGRIDVEDAIEALEDFKTELDKDHTLAFDTSSADGAKDTLSEIEEKMMRLEGMTSTVTVNVAGGNVPLPREQPGFQHGGSFTVGGAGGPDSQMVAFMATPGERVTVTPQGRGGGAGGGVTIHNLTVMQHPGATMEQLLGATWQMPNG